MFLVYLLDTSSHFITVCTASCLHVQEDTKKEEKTDNAEASAKPKEEKVNEDKKEEKDTAKTDKEKALAIAVLWTRPPCNGDYSLLTRDTSDFRVLLYSYNIPLLWGGGGAPKGSCSQLPGRSVSADAVKPALVRKSLQMEKSTAGTQPPYILSCQAKKGEAQDAAAPVEDEVTIWDTFVKALEGCQFHQGFLPSAVSCFH